MVYQIAASTHTRSTSETPSFQIEVSGLHQNETTEHHSYVIRSSSGVVITVPLNRFNTELQRINRLGGKIVRIQPLISGSDRSAS